MQGETMIKLRVFLPFRQFFEEENILQVVAETTEGSFGFLPHRLDCVASLIPGILGYQTQEAGEKYLAIDKGILIKAGSNITISVRNAMAGKDLHQLRDVVKNQFLTLSEEEKIARSVLAKMEGVFVQKMVEFHND
jgi:F-type H+-transporting ATPase subunit epsilon